jgi:hypothetical protein
MNEAVAQVKKTRLLCEDCFLNQGGMAGQAITQWDCAICNGQHVAGSTATPRVCKGCAITHGLCEDCGVKKHIYQEAE